MDTITRNLPEIDSTVAAQTGNAILLDAATTDKVKRVSGSNRSGIQSHNARAWTKSGDVD